MEEAIKIVGHLRQRQRLEKLWRLDKLPSALMFTGANGIGKSLVAKELFQSLFCEKGDVYGGCHACRACHLFEAGNHPDFHEKDFINKEDTNVDGLRDLLYSLHLGAFNGGSRVILFHNIELISVQGANLLLKILEEPRPNTYFCLLSSNPTRLPATIMSRCHNWFFDKLSSKEIQTILENNHKDSSLSHNADLLLLADGTLEHIDTIENNMDLWKDICHALEKISKGDIAFLSSFVSELTSAKDELREKLKMISLYARSKLLNSSSSRERYTWSIFLTNILEAEPYIFERNLSANYLLSLVFQDLASQNATNQPQETRGRLLHEIVI